MNLREAWSASLGTGLAWTPEVERAIDRVAAGGFCKALGLALFYARYKNDARAYREAMRVLKRIVARRYATLSAVERSAMVEQAMREYVWSACMACRGVGELNTARLRVVCQACGGAKVQRYSDRQRAHEMGITVQRVRTLGRSMKWLSEYIEKHDRQANAMLVAQLRGES